jgi:hypothetical protein
MNRRQYTIRSVPEHVDHELRRRARKQNKSLNTVILETLEQALAPPQEPILHHDLDFLIGTWVEDPEFDKAIERFEQIDEEYWK